MYIPGSDFGSRWDVEFTFASSERIRDVLLSAFARISRDTLHFAEMRKFDPGLWRIDLRPDVHPVPALVLTLVVDGRPVQGFGMSSDVRHTSTTCEIAGNFQDFDEWLQWPTLPDGRHLTPRRIDGRPMWGRNRNEVVAPIGELTDYIERQQH